MYDGHQRPHVGVDDRRRGALVLALLAQDLARERDVRLRAAPRPGSRRSAARARGRGRSGGSRRRRTRRPSRAGAPASARLSSSSSGPDDGAVRGDALVQLEAEVPLDERRRLAPEEVVHVRDAQPAQLEHVAEAGGRDERGRGCRAARARRSSPPSSRARPPRPAPSSASPPTASTTASVVARRGREQLADRDAAVGAVQDHVGERAADVDADPGFGNSSRDEI